MSEQQSSQLLPGLFEAIEEDQRIRVLHIGPAQPETVNFFSGFRCTLYINDLFAELPLGFEPGDEETVHQRIDQLLDFPEGTQFDFCLFWDIFNYLDEEAVSALMDVLRRHLAPGARAHCFAVHNLRSPQRDCKFSMVSATELKLRPRARPLRGYAPHSQGRLKELLTGFEVQRSVLLADSRLELLLRVKAAS